MGLKYSSSIPPTLALEAAILNFTTVMPSSNRCCGSSNPTKEIRVNESKRVNTLLNPDLVHQNSQYRRKRHGGTPSTRDQVLMKDLFVNLTSPESEDHAVLDMHCRVFAVVGEDDGNTLLLD